MQLVALLGYSENGNDARLAFFSPVVTFVFRLPIKNLKMLTSTNRKDASIDLRDTLGTTTHDFNFLRCFYSYQLAKFSGSLPVPEPEDAVLKHHINYLAYSVAAGTVVLILMVFGTSFYLFKGESSRERRERLKRKLFSNKFLRFLRVKARGQRLEVARSERSKAPSTRSDWVNPYKTVRKIQVASPSSTKTEEGSRAAGSAKTERRSNVEKSTPDLKTIDSTAASEQRTPKEEVLPENILKFKSGSFKSDIGKMRETKNKITSLMDKIKEVKKSLQ